MLDALDVAELRGITLEEVAQLRRKIAAKRQKRRTIGEMLTRFPQISQSLSRAS